LEGPARAVVPVPGEQSARSTQIVHEEPTDLVFVVFFVCSCVLVFRSVLSTAFGCSEFARWSARRVWTVSFAWTVCG
jgi:hypothetical protein